MAEQPGEFGPEPSGRTAADWLDAVKDAERRGELLLAVDLAERGLAEHPHDLRLSHRAVLAMAHSGSTVEAARRFAEYGLDEVEEEDIAALGARIAKDQALSADGSLRRERAARAAESYRRIFLRTGGYYTAITHLVLGDEPAAAEALERAAAAADGDYGALATTRRQLRTICAITGADLELLGILSGPTVAHYCGHRIAAADGQGRFSSETEAEAARHATQESCVPSWREENHGAAPS